VSAKYRQLTKFLVLSVVSFCIGTLHGMLQVMPPVRRWLDSIGSPYGGPGHMIDPLAHAHMNLVGGVVLLAMGVTYYLVPIFTGRQIRSERLVEWTFWCTALGAYSFYVVQLLFGIWEGQLMHSAPEQIGAAHRYYGPAVAVSGTVMAAGFFCYLVNIGWTLAGAPRVDANSPPTAPSNPA
jgi:cytochrome c oxidase cbb3-type subunit 1